MDKATYIIPVWRGTRTCDLEASLKSLQHEIHLVDQVIIVYDGHDSFCLSYDIDQDLVSKILSVYIYKNSGPGVARNYGVTFSRSQYIFFLDAGDINSCNRTEMQLSLLLNGYEASYGDIEEFYGIHKTRISTSCRQRRMLFFICHFRAPFNNVTLAIKKEPFRRIGGFYCSRVAEDWVLMARLVSVHAKIGIISLPLVRVDARQTFVSRRRGLKVFLEIKKALNEISRLDSFSYSLVVASLIAQFCTRVILPRAMLSSLYSILRKN